MKTRFWMGVFGMAAVVGLAGFGRCGGHHPRDPAEMAAFARDRVDDVLDDLDATDAQRTQIHAIEERLLARGLELRKGAQPLHEELFAQWQSANPDRAELHALVDRHLEAMRAFAHEAVDAGVEVHGVLTPEQRAKVTKKLERAKRFHP